jgi:L-lactate dehydrogenase complex protein LldE
VGGLPHKVGLHDSCSAVRGLGHARPSELTYEPYFSKTRDLLGNVAGLELIEIDRPDECCGFGGLFHCVQMAPDVMNTATRRTDDSVKTLEATQQTGPR